MSFTGVAYLHHVASLRVWFDLLEMTVFMRM